MDVTHLKLAKSIKKKKINVLKHHVIDTDDIVSINRKYVFPLRIKNLGTNMFTENRLFPTILAVKCTRIFQF